MNFDRFLYIISKWPMETVRKQLDYGVYLRELVKRKDLQGNVFPGNSVENSKKLDALLRLLSDTYNNKYPCAKKKGSSELETKTIDVLLTTEVFKKVTFTLKKIDDKKEDPKLDIKKKDLKSAT